MATNPAAEEALIPTIREAVITRIERTSLREIARQTGLTPSGLDKFVNGADPYRKTRWKLEAWYTRTFARLSTDEGAPSPETAAAALRILALFHPPAKRTAFVDAMIEQMEEALPSASDWRQQFEVYAIYMRAGEM